MIHLEDIFLTAIFMLLFLLALPATLKRNRKLGYIHLCLFAAYNAAFFYLLNSDYSKEGVGLLWWTLQLAVIALHALVLWGGIVYRLLHGRRKKPHDDGRG
ncbi:hypothetical protein [Prevotella sp. KH2C16]|uniref:hypothetical protein n=1 Tax=Prevotella sp. KH2C16 TaxID=1855325 RepID=UPI0008E9858B|nr:hypothetical protein [Prevotella sp. KH2C16]SFG26554.1 hypothetical protein SAMN05216383_10879 [Prevotella sp. KH2C16]